MRAKKVSPGIRRAGMTSGIPVCRSERESNDQVGRNDQQGRGREEGVKEVARWRQSKGL